MRSHDPSLRETRPVLHIRAREPVRVRELSWEFPRDNDAPIRSERPRTDRGWEPWRWPASW